MLTEQSSMLLFTTHEILELMKATGFLFITGRKMAQMATAMQFSTQCHIPTETQMGRDTSILLW